MLSRAVLSFAAVLIVASSAAADVPPPDVCDTLGSSCTTPDGVAGQCQASTCSRLDYSDGTPPSTVNYDCNRCLPSETPPPAADDSGCSTGGPMKAVGPLALVALAWSVLFIRRRRTS